MTTRSNAVATNTLDSQLGTNTLAIGITTAGIVVIGRAGGTQTNLNSPLTTVAGNLGLVGNIILTTVNSPTEQTQLGGKSTATGLATAPVNGSVYGTITITTAGVYLLTFGVSQIVSSLGNINYVNLGGTGVTGINYGATNITASQIGFNGSQVVSCSASNYTLTLSTNSTFTVAGTINFTATRIG